MFKKLKKHCAVSLVHHFSKCSTLSITGKKILRSRGSNSGPSKNQIKTAIKRYINLFILLYFVNCSQIFYPCLRISIRMVGMVNFNNLQNSNREGVLQ